MARLFKMFLFAATLAFGLNMIAPAEAEARTPGCVTASDGVLECEHSTSNYVGWTLWRAAAKMGVLDEIGAKHNVRIKVRFYPNYDESMKAFNRGDAASVNITNMDMILSPVNAGLGVDVVLAGTWSNGNDAIVSRWATSLKELVGTAIHMFQNSVTDYLWSRFIEDNGYKYKNFEVRNTTEDKIVGIFTGDPKATAGTWMPFVLDLKSVPRAHVIVDSSQYPEEIIDLLVVRRNMPQNARDALAEAWFRVVDILHGKEGKAKVRQMKALMATEAQCTPAQLEQQLKSTAFYLTPADSIALMSGKKLQTTMQRVINFIARQGQLPDYGNDPNGVGMQYPDGTVQGDTRNLMIRWETRTLKRLK